MTNEELAVLIQSGRQDLLPELWQQVERFAMWRASRMSRLLEGRCGVTFEDLYQCGYLALVNAVETFSADKGGTFIGMYNFALLNEFADLGGWRTQRQKKDPLNNAMSLDAPVDAWDDDSAALGELVPNPAAEEDLLDVDERDRAQRLHNTVQALLQEIPELQADVIRLRFYQNMPLKETGAALGISADKARQTEAKALRTLRLARYCQELRRHLG